MVINTAQQCFRCLLKYCSYCAAFVAETVWIVRACVLTIGY